MVWTAIVVTAVVWLVSVVCVLVDHYRNSDRYRLRRYERQRRRFERYFDQ